MSAFVSSVAYDDGHPNALAVYCSDGRFTDAVEELVQSLGHDRLDTLTLPGGPASLNPLASLFTEHEVLSQAAKFLIEGHHIEEVVLLAHHGCGHYRARFFAMDAEFIEARQVEDLKAAAAALKAAHPGLKIDAFFARPANGKVRFEPVGLDG